MSDVVIYAAGLGKRYRIGHQANRYRTLRESLTGIVLAPGRKVKAIIRGEPLRRVPETIWALEDLDLEVRQGEVLGIIGRNGAGKSTLLKVLARITEPTTGRIELRGRVGSLLEVGTGFHPELTGLENIFLNGAILGMRRAEIGRKLDRIIEFAEVERFIDTPVKRYSSGMAMRLAFSVAAHLEPEILVIDEVLAVGDAEFQRKCLGKMGEVARGGRTVLFVSHNLSVVEQLCDRVMLLDGGKAISTGKPSTVVHQYVSKNSQQTLLWENTAHTNETPARILRLFLSSGGDRPADSITMSDHLVASIEFELTSTIRDLQINLQLTNHHGDHILVTAPQDARVEPPSDCGHYSCRVGFPDEILLRHRYGLRACLWEPTLGTLDETPILYFDVHESSTFASRVRDGNRRSGYVALKCAWQLDDV